MKAYYGPRVGEAAFEKHSLPNARCYDSSSLQLESETDLLNVKTIVSVFENCREYDSEENCASVNDTNAFWDANNQVYIEVSVPLKQAVLKDMPEPI